MAALPPSPNALVEQLYRWRETHQDEGFRLHLGASQIGKPCARALWYSFRWCTPAQHSGRLLRLFARGQREEEVFLEELRGIGCEVLAEHEGHQWRVSALGGHFGGSMDAVARGIPEAPKTWHVCEFKTHNAKSFAKLSREGVEKSKPEHAAQMRVYMHLARIERALYLAVNKDTDDLYAERLRVDHKEGRRLVDRAETVIFAAEPPARLSEDPAWWECKFCDHRGVCHGGRLPAVTCRSCLHATPEREGEARWSCRAWGADIPGWAEQRAACPRHVFVPTLVTGFSAVDATESGVIYHTADGAEWEQGPAGLSSVGFARLGDPALAGEPLLHDALEVFDDAEVVR